MKQQKDRINVSAVIIARNEADNLPRCLSALNFFDDILVVDDFSEDNTADIATQSGARVLSHAMKDFADQRNWAMENGGLKYDWVMHLDADEVLTPELIDEISQRLRAADGNLAGFYVSRKTMLGNRWLRYSATYPAWVPRLVHQNRVTFSQVGHGEKIGASRGRMEYLKNPFLHYNFSKGWTDWFDRHNRYSSMEAKNLIEQKSNLSFFSLFSSDPDIRRRALRVVSYRLPLRPWLRFFYVYFIRLGFLDGKSGLTYTVLQAIYEYMICLKIKEMKHKGQRA
jgi:glycosyltransferase involved in cell wall biosynthesis